MTDSRNYAGLSVHGALRFCPYASARADIGRVHGTDERIALPSLRGTLCTTRAALALLGGAGAGGSAGGSPPGSGGGGSQPPDEL